MKTNLTLDPNIAQMLNAYGEEQSKKVQDYLDHPEKLSTFMDFKVDYAFKYILGHKPVLLKLINDILPVEVSDIEYLPNEIPVVSPKERRAAFDVICTAKATGEKFITEMQCLPDVDMDDRLLFYGYQLREQSQPNDILTRQLQLFFLELPRLQKKWEKLETNPERWCYLFGNLNTFVEPPQDQAGFDDVFALAQTGELEGNELKQYINSMLDEYRITVTTEYARQDGYKKGKKDGKEEGKKEGVAEGIEIVAKNMLARHDSVESVVEVTGLSLEAIQALQ